MMIEPFTCGDTPCFLEMARAEGWVADAWEFDFLLASFPAGCFTARDETGASAGFVTALRHDRSGWIGNLIVKEQARGKGIGARLFLRALAALQEAGAATIWLTASKAGQSLYERHGFRRIDTIERWLGTGCGWPTGTAPPAPEPLPAMVSALDEQGWGDCRTGLLAAIAERGTVIARPGGFAVLQPCGDAFQLGPFSARDGCVADELLHAALMSVPRGKKLVLDAPHANRAGQRLLSRTMQGVAGRNELMFAGTKPAYAPELVFGLASMGSMG